MWEAGAAGAMIDYRIRRQASGVLTASLVTKSVAGRTSLPFSMGPSTSLSTILAATSAGSFRRPLSLNPRNSPTLGNSAGSRLLMYACIPVSNMPGRSEMQRKRGVLHSATIARVSISSAAFDMRVDQRAGNGRLRRARRHVDDPALDRVVGKAPEEEIRHDDRRRRVRGECRGDGARVEAPEQSGGRGDRRVIDERHRRGLALGNEAQRRRDRGGEQRRLREIAGSEMEALAP